MPLSTEEMPLEGSQPPTYEEVRLWKQRCQYMAVAGSSDDTWRAAWQAAALALDHLESKFVRQQAARRGYVEG